MFFYLLFIFLHIHSIESSFQIISARENENVTITCEFNRIKSKLSLDSLSPLPSLNGYFDHSQYKNIILWYKDDTQVIGVNSIANDPRKYSINQINMNTYQLTILNVQLESSGSYKCQNFTAKEETRFQLNVMVAPTRVRLTPSMPMPIADGTLVAFNCIAERVYPNPIFEWYKNDKLVQRSIGNQTNLTRFSSSSILTLLLTPADHNHILRCQVSNDESTGGMSAYVQFDVLFKPIVKILIDEIEITKTLNIIENTIDTVRCQILSNPSIISNIDWLKNDQLILGENQEELRVNFTNLQNLACRARNLIGETEANININIIYKPKLSMIESLNLNQSDKLHLKCSIDANPSCQHIRWFHNEKELLVQPCTKTVIAEYIIDRIDRSHAGQYICEVKNHLNTTFDQQYDGIARVSTDVRIQYAPFVLNAFNKLAVTENSNITAECVVDAYPKAEIVWYGPYGQMLNSFTRIKQLNSTIVSSQLFFSSSDASKLGFYQCIAKNSFGEYEFTLKVQRPSLPDPPSQLQVTNITHNSFKLSWRPGFNGGFNQVYRVIVNGSHVIEKSTNITSIQFHDLNEKSRYSIRIFARNRLGFSDPSIMLNVSTKEVLIRREEFPVIHQAYFDEEYNRLYFQLAPVASMSMSINQLCIQYYNDDNDIPECVPLKSISSIEDGLDIDIDEKNLRVKLCLLNQTDICSKSISVLSRIQLSNHSSSFFVFVIGGILVICIVFGLLVLCICIRQHSWKRKSKTGSTDTLKTNSDHFHSIGPIRVSDTNSCLYYPTKENRTMYFNDETVGVYSIQNKKNSFCFDSGIPSIASNNSDSVGSQALSSLDSYDRSDGDYLVNGRRSTNKIILSNAAIYATRDNHTNVPFNARISSEEGSDFSTLSQSQNGKKLVYEVVV